MHYVYILENQIDRSWYIGFSSDLKQRVIDHQNGKGGRTTKKKKDWLLIYLEGYVNKDDALGREKYLKSGSGRRFVKKQLGHYLNYP
jgi:putative endonuclease